MVFGGMIVELLLLLLALLQVLGRVFEMVAIECCLPVIPDPVSCVQLLSPSLQIPIALDRFVDLLIHTVCTPHHAPYSRGRGPRGACSSLAEPIVSSTITDKNKVVVVDVSRVGRSTEAGCGCGAEVRSGSIEF